MVSAEVCIGDEGWRLLLAELCANAEASIRKNANPRITGILKNDPEKRFILTMASLFSMDLRHEQYNFRDSQLFEPPVEKFRQVGAHSGDHRERTSPFKVAGVGRRFFQGAWSSDMPSGTRGGARNGYSEGLRWIQHFGNAELE